jgi:glycosyltransferase involved in cell wall biosynthesis
MRILIAHSWNLLMSGENMVAVDEARLLEEAGHDVRTWLPRPEQVSGLGLLRTSGRAIWSRWAAAELRKIVAEQRTEVLHVHNLFPTLSPLVLRAARSQGVAVAMTLHNYRLSCLPATFLREGKPCEQCLGHVPWRGIVHRCYRDSYPGSAVLAASLTLHRGVHSFDAVSRFAAVSSFVREKVLESGIVQPDRIGVKANFAWPTQRREGPGEYFLYLGRLHSEKGVDTLLEAWRRGAPGKLLVVGDGPEAASLRAAAPAGVEFTGIVEPERVPGILLGARAVLVSSRWYEAAPRSILEAYAAGVPVLSSDFGSLPELVEHDVTGLRVQLDSPAAWAEAVTRLGDDAESERLGEGAWRMWNDKYSPQRGLEGLETLYREALAMNTTTTGGKVV